MEVSREMAQMIVERINSAIPFSINITNKDAVVVGSTDSSRLGTYHPICAEILATGKAIEVYEDASDYKAGIGLPIIFAGQPIGVIGITGQPDKMRGYIGITKALVELLIEHEALRQDLRLEKMARKSFITDLILGSIAEEDSWKQRAQLLALDMNLQRVVVVLEMGWREKLGKWNDGTFSDQKTRLAFYEVIESICCYPQDMILDLDDDHIVILGFTGTLIHNKNGPGRIRSLLTRIQKRVRAMGASMTVGVSSHCLRISDYAEGYKEALEALTIGKRLYGRNGVYHIQSLKLGRIIVSILPAIREKLVCDIIGKLDSHALGDVLLSTLKDYCQYGSSSLSRTAQAMRVHPNTVRYRLKKIYEITGLDPRCPDDLLLLRVATLCHLYDSDK